MTAHTSALDHALAEALHTADAIHFDVLKRASDGTPTDDGAPTEYRVTAWDGLNRHSADSATVLEALAMAMRMLQAGRDAR